MKIKVTLISVIFLIKLSLSACNGPSAEDELIRYNEQLDSIGSSRIDSAYRRIKEQCDTAQKYRLPSLIDSLLKPDSLHE